MIQLSCESTGLGHLYQNKFLFRNLDLKLFQGQIQFLTGRNGAGKSTLLKILTGALTPTEGVVNFSENGNVLELEEACLRIGFAAPYQELPEDLTIKELIAFQNSLEPDVNSGNNYRELIELFRMEKETGKLIRHFSTGMKQKTRFILNLGCGRPFWFLDEPTSNLDVESATSFWRYVQAKKQDRLIVVASNDPAEFHNADSTLVLSPE